MSSIAEIIQWPACPDIPSLAAKEIHVWAAPLSVSSPALDKLAATLSADEIERARKFKFEKHRNRFIAGRGTLRKILSEYLRTNPADLRFVLSTNGKPVLSPDFAKTGIHFNLAHSEDLALLAVTRVAAVGVDVEYIHPIKDMDELVARFFSPRENEAFQKVAANEKPTSFFNLWTRKEALLKATGEGITRSLKLVEVSFLPSDPARLLAISGDTAKAAQWTLRELSPATGFTGAIAIQAQDVGVRCLRW